ncbi:MAG: hypothetical protein JW997_06375 [Actinobacteria bacterium]|nr:hypothetical protein [Actinomycetota bacterium]
MKKVNNFWIILLKCIGWLVLGAAAGYAFFYFFSDLSVNIIQKYKFLQGIFGISQASESSTYISVILLIIAANLISTAAYFILSYFRLLIPLSIITGFLMTLLLFTGAVIRNISIPGEVIALFAIEAFYRCIALSGGEHLFKNRLNKKFVFISTIISVFLLIIAAAFYEAQQIFG